mgnify:CR=1 FL=1
MAKIDDLLNLPWSDFCDAVSDFKLKELHKALKKELGDKNRSSYVKRLQERIRKLTAKELFK